MAENVSGTIVVLHEEEPDRIVIAADSRVVTKRGNTRVSYDKDCKLLPLDRNGRLMNQLTSGLAQPIVSSRETEHNGASTLF